MPFQYEQLYVIHDRSSLSHHFLHWLQSLSQYEMMEWADVLHRIQDDIVKQDAMPVTIVIVQGERAMKASRKAWLSKAIKQLEHHVQMMVLSPVCIIVTAHNPDPYVYSMLVQGIDDVILFPCMKDEWIFRLQKAQRGKWKRYETQDNVMNIDNLTVDLTKRLVYRGSTLIDLTPREYELLYVLASHADIPLARTYLLEKVWNIDFETNTNIVDVYIRYLRRKIDRGQTHKLIRTVRGYGYKLASPTS